MASACGQSDDIERIAKDGGYTVGRGSICNRPEINPLASDLNMLLFEAVPDQTRFRRVEKMMLDESLRAANDVANRRAGRDGVGADLKALAADVARRRAQLASK
jgi:hypothetical protein